MKKKMPVWLVTAIDLLLTGAILCTFCYFHHIRILWGEVHDDVIEQFGKDEGTDNNENEYHFSHTWELSESVPVTCTTDGYDKYTCKCGEVKYDNRASATGHRDTEVVGAVDATYESNGYVGDTYCKDCNALLQKGWETPSLEHSDTVLINAREATCTELGYSGDYKCIECGDIVATGVVLSLKEHNYLKAETVKPDCINEGYTVYRCSACNKESRRDYLPKDDHTPGSNGYCTGCNMCMFDMSGDFGAAFPEMFAYDKTVTLTDDTEIREYAEKSGITLQDHPDGKFISLYRSHDIFVSLLEVNTKLYYEGTNKTYYVQYFVYDIYVRNIENMFTVTTEKRDYSTEELIAKGEETSGGPVIATINGDYLGNKNHCLFALRNGSLLRSPEVSKNQYLESDACILYFDGTLETISPNEYTAEKLAEIKAGRPYQIWNFGPSLLDENGKAISEYDESSYDDHVIDERNPRAALGYYQPGHYSFIAVDGRSDDSQGVRMVQLARLFEELGCKVAYNMDGGDSAQAYFGYEMIRGDQERGDDQRNLYDIICIGEVQKDEDN